MPRLRVIILDQTSDDANTYNCVMWADVPAARQSYYANANAKSAWNGATAADNTNLQTGVMVEQLTVQRVPPNMFKPRLRSALVTTFDGVMPVVDAALNTTTGFVTAWPLGFIKPSEAFGADVVRAEPPAAASSAVTREKIKPPRVDADARPEIRISSTSMIAVPLPPLIAIHCGVVGEVMAAPAALAIQDMLSVEKTRFAMFNPPSGSRGV